MASQRDDDLDSMYSDDLQVQNLVLGTIEEQDAAREACADGDNDPDVVGSVVSSVESCFDDVSLGASALRIESRDHSSMEDGLYLWWPSDLTSGLHQVEISTATDPNEGSNGDPDPEPDAGLESNPDSLSNPASSPEQADSQTEGPPDHPAFPILWARAPRHYEIEEMPGFLHFDIQNGRRVAIFDERTWKEGFTRGLRRHIMKRARRDDDCDE
ncbi:hypothetical protein KVR01_007871 [Diaporthe batatas]|uniref:uncharacterized protein n=1 Tax=Diaporthe batatas TaxID=748121 RepID=UPI001D059BC0|nr:uncharacterized protein KVR01_007871 [Diaporthe batatas]KAG8162106.1 hypothetical protein KVR01_007871 [Diaporthe batatas]